MIESRVEDTINLCRLLDRMRRLNAVEQHQDESPTRYVQSRVLAYDWRVFPILLALILALGIAGCRGEEPEAVVVEGGDPDRGAELIVSYDCGSCHYIPGIDGADGREAPGLQLWPNRSFVAGAAPNEPENVMHFLMNPNSIQPGSGMPDLGISEDEARDITAYLFTIRTP